MGGSSSKHCLVKFKDNLSEKDYEKFRLDRYHFWKQDDCRWITDCNVEENHITMMITEDYGGRFEFIYQIKLVSSLGSTIVIRGVGSFEKSGAHYVNVLNTRLCQFPIWKFYSRINFQAKIYAVLDEFGIRCWYFKDPVIYAEPKMMLVKKGGVFYIPMELISTRLPLLAVGINENKFCDVSGFTAERFFEILLGAHVQLKPKKLKPLLKLAVEYKVLVVKRYCEQQLIRRDDLGFSNLQKYRFARKFDLIHLMHKLLHDIKTMEGLGRFAKRRVDGKLMNMNIAKLIFGRMYELS